MRASTETDHLERIMRVVDHLRSDPERTLSLVEIAEIAALSPFHVIRVFRQTTGYTPAAMQTALRIQAAKRLLVAEQASVTDACFAVGFSSLGSFSQRFTTLAGVNPSDYRIAGDRADDLAEDLVQLRRAPMAPSGERHTVSGRLCGEVVAAALYFVGLFPIGLPQGVPLRGDVLNGPGEFVIRHVPDGIYNIYSAVVLHARQTVDWVLPDSEVQTGGGQVVEMVDGMPVDSIEIELMPRSRVITPITTTLMAIPEVVEIARRNHIPNR